METVTQFVFSHFCHQDPSILGQSAGAFVWLCPRCIGLHLGFVFAWITVTSSPARRVTAKHSGDVLFLFALIAVPFIHWLLAGLLEWNTHEWPRLLSGLIGGAGAALLVREHGASRGVEDSVRRASFVPGVVVVVFLAVTAGVLFRLVAPAALLAPALLATLTANAIVFGSQLIRALCIRFINLSLPNMQKGVSS